MDKKVLIVDDNPIHRTLLTNFFLTKGYGSDEAANGIEALEKLSGESYTVILLDLLMPGMNGYETVRNIRARGIMTPVIAQSSLSLKQDRERCIESGCTDFVPKPIDLKELWEVVQRYSEMSHEQIVQDDEGADATHVANGLIDLCAGYTALLVEEDDIRAEQYEQILKNLGLAVQRASNGNDAVEIFNVKYRTIDIIISNIFTSGIDGLGLATIIKRTYPHTMVFIYTEEEDRDTIQLAVNIGADGVLTRGTFETMIGSSIETALYQSLIKKAISRDTATAEQVRQSQERLASYGYFDSPYIDAASSMFMDAGGDLVLVRRFNLAGRYGIVLGDVSGHDVRSSYISAIFLGIITSIWDRVQNPLELLKTLNIELLKLDDSQYHVCVTALLWDQMRGTVEIASAGNPGVLILNAENDDVAVRTETEGGGMCLGMLARDDLYHNETILLPDHDYLILFSDGINVEKLKNIAKNRLGAYTGKNINGFSREVIERLESDGDRDDDMILVTLQGQPVTASGVNFQVLSSYEEVNRASDWIAEQLERLKTPIEKDHDYLLLAVREALLNAVEHGNRKDPLAYIDITLIPSTDYLRIDISDQGSGFNLKEKLTIQQKIDGMQVGKRGLQLMNAFSDKLEINGGTVSLYFYYEITDYTGGVA